MQGGHTLAAGEYQDFATIGGNRLHNGAVTDCNAAQVRNVQYMRLAGLQAQRPIF